MAVFGKSTLMYMTLVCGVSWAPGREFILLFIQDEEAISQALVWGPLNSNRLLRLVSAAGLVTSKKIGVHQRGEGVI